MKAYFYQISCRTWRVMDSAFRDVGRIRELSGGRLYVRIPGHAAIVTSALGDIQADLLI